MKRLFFTLILLAACSSQQPTPTPPTPHDETVTQVTPPWFHPPRSVRAELKPDIRSPEEITAAACRGPSGQWFCKTPQSPSVRASSATAVGPIIPPSWTVPQWYVDPSNSSGAASDNNNCTTTSTPCLTWHEINDHRWGCLGSPQACPRLRQNTNITFLSSHTTNADPVIFLPSIENSSFVTMQGAAPTVVATVSLSGVTPRSTAAGSNSLLIANLGASATVNMLLENTTHPSRAWSYASLGGNSFSITQPMVKLATPFAKTSPAEVNTWTTGDSVKLMVPIAINIVQAIPVMTDLDPVTSYNVLNIYQLSVFNPASDADQMVLGEFSAIGETSIGRVANISGGFSGNTDTLTSFNSLMNSGSLSTYCSFFMYGGAIGAAVSATTAAILLDEDVIIGGGGFQISGGRIEVSRVYLDATLSLFTGNVQIVQQFFTPAIVYGSATGTILVTGNSRVAVSGDTYAHIFTAPTLISPGISLNGSSTGCSSTGGATPTIACGISTTPAHLDAAAGAAGFGGNAFVLGGASVESSL
jgi:hypothetical protein